MFEILQPYIDNIITLLLGGFIGWFPNRKKEQITNQQSIVDLYQESLTDLKLRYEEKYQDLKLTFDEKISNVSNELSELRKSLDEWKKKYFTLKKDFDNYKKEHP
jgi:molecular chaperone GrpE (heat shock protein)